MPEVNDADRYYLDYKIGMHHKFRRLISGATFLFALYVSINKNDHWEMPLIGLMGLLFFDFILVYLEKGYRLSYDREHIYMRPFGCQWNLRFYPELSIAFDDIELTCEQMAPGVGAMQKHFMPFDHIRLYGALDVSLWQDISAQPQDYIIISPDNLTEAEGLPLLEEIYHRKPDTFSDALRNYMQGDKKWS